MLTPQPSRLSYLYDESTKLLEVDIWQHGFYTKHIVISNVSATKVIATIGLLKKANTIPATTGETK